MQTSELFLGTGRRKRAVARVRVTLGQGVITINKKPIDDYFPRAVLQQIVRQPLEVTQSGSRFDVNVSCAGGGPAGQAGAVRHGIARALLEMDANIGRAVVALARSVNDRVSYRVPDAITKDVHSQ